MLTPTLAMTDTQAIRVIFVEDDGDVRMGGTQALQLAGLQVEGFGSVEEARSRIQVGAPVVVLCDVKLPGMAGTDWLTEIRAIDPDLPVILVTGHGDIAMAVRAMRHGAYDFIEKPYSSDALVAVVRRAAEKRQLTLQVHALREQLENWHGIQAVLLGRSAQMQKVRRTVLNLATTSADVVIYGETGTGKDMVARCLHDHSDRRRGNYVPLNCGGLPEALAESELFGHEVGAFTALPVCASASSNMPTAARCSWTRSRACRWRCRSSSCARCRSGASSTSAPTSRSPSIAGWSPPPRRT
jgi:two-component system, NtrC family, C4-dicarboxylate transport response regulator DctD